MKLATKHLFPFLKLMGKLNIKDEIKSLFMAKINVKDKTEEEVTVLQQQKGMDMVFLLIEKIPYAEKEFYDFFSMYTGKKVDEIKEQEIGETINMVTSLFKDESFTSFFKFATK